MAGRALATPKKAETKPTSAVPTEEQIRQRAHEIYMERGCENGFDMDDWLQAEDELRRAQEKGLAD